MLGWFNRKERLLGIDIGDSSVKLIELDRKGPQFRVAAIAVEPLPEGAMAERAPADLDQVSVALRQALKTSGSRLKKAAIAVPTSSIITRTVALPAGLSETELAASVLAEAAPLIPFPLEEAYLDFQVQGRSRNHPATEDVLVVACRRENVDLRREALNDAGLKTAVVDVEAYALENTCRLLANGPVHGDDDSHQPRPDVNQPLALVDMGAAVTTLYILQDGQVTYSREQNFGTDRLILAIAAAYDWPRRQAELASQTGELPAGFELELLAPFRKSAAEQISRMLQFFFSSSPVSAVDRILLVGGGALTADLDQTVAGHTGIPTATGNPFARLGGAVLASRPRLARAAPLFAVACGLALRSLN